MKNKKRLLANIGGIIVMLLMVAYIANKPGHIPPYDANLVRLAETQRQGYCAGMVFWKTSGDGSAGQAATCRQETKNKSGEVNLNAAETGFCQAIVDAGWEGGVYSCLDILHGQQLWPTYNGSITDQWNRARPYPKSAISGAGEDQDNSRTGGRSPGAGRSGSADRPNGGIYGNYP